ncbi:MAG: molybdenum cofactor guanylyltransferase MobA [Pikeienuella sp.]
MKTCGVILAGGLASRMGGGDKAMRMIAGRSLMERVVERLSGQFRPIALNANGDAARFAEFGLPVIADSMDDRPGPLAGVLAGMDWAAGQGCSHVLTVAADTPFYPVDLMERLGAGLSAEHNIALAATPDETRKSGLARHPTFGLWPVDLRDDLRGALQDGVRKVVQWANPHGVRLVEFPVTPFDPFFNVNTPDDMAKAESLATEYSL